MFIKILENVSFNHIIVHLNDIFITFKYYSCVFNICKYVLSMLYSNGPQYYIMSICYQINIHECYLNDWVLTNINICFSPSMYVAMFVVPFLNIYP